MLIRKELGDLPRGRPHPFYMRDEVERWESRSPLWKEGGWFLVADEYVPDEVAVWRYHKAIPPLVPPRWLIPLEAEEIPDLPSPEIEVFQEIIPGRSPKTLVGRPVWRLSLRLTDELEWQTSLILLPPALEEPLHLSLALDERFFAGILLMRALRKALMEKGLTQVIFWTRPASHLLEVSPHLPEAGLEENLIQLTTYATSAILGGSSYIYIPAIRPGDSHAERWSRNISHILRHEVPYVATTPDPLAGSFFLEVETDRLAKQLVFISHDRDAAGLG